MPKRRRVPAGNNEQLVLAEYVVRKITPVISNCPIRFGRTHKVDRRFIGVSRYIWWQGPCARRGGSFVIVCDYGDLKGQAHSTVLKKMLSDYSEYLQMLSRSNAVPKKGRKPFSICRTQCVNMAVDLEFFVGGMWQPLCQILPTKVRELDQEAVLKWVDEEVEDQESIQMHPDFEELSKHVRQQHMRYELQPQQ